MRPLHCTTLRLTAAIAPNVGDSGAQFLLVGDCVRAVPRSITHPLKRTRGNHCTQQQQHTIHACTSCRKKFRQHFPIACGPMTIYTNSRAPAPKPRIEAGAICPRPTDSPERVSLGARRHLVPPTQPADRNAGPAFPTVLRGVPTYWVSSGKLTPITHNPTGTIDRRCARNNCPSYISNIYIFVQFSVETDSRDNTFLGRDLLNTYF